MVQEDAAATSLEGASLARLPPLPEGSWSEDPEGAAAALAARCAHCVLMLAMAQFYRSRAQGAQTPASAHLLAPALD